MLHLFKCLKICALAGLTLTSTTNTFAKQMTDPSIDDRGDFTYLAKTSTSIGMMGSDRSTQVTFEGALYTGSAELCFFFGKDLQPVLNRSKRLLDGWMPIVQFDQEAGGVLYEIEYFSMPLDGNPKSDAVLFARMKLINITKGDRDYEFAAATRYNTFDHRIVEMNRTYFDVSSQYEMGDQYTARDGKLIYTFDKNAVKQAVFDDNYTAPFKGSKKFITETTPVGISRFAGKLKFGETKEFYFKIPHTPVALEDAHTCTQIINADYKTFRNKTINYWNNIKTQGSHVFIPEKKVQSAHLANMMYTWQAIYPKDNGKWLQGVNKFQYKGFWLRDAAYLIHNDDVWGYHKLADELLKVFPEYQGENGLFYTYANQLDGFGQALYILANHAIVSGDKENAKKVYPMFKPALEWLKRERAKDSMNLMPYTDVGDNEAIRGHFTGHNFWALLGLREGAKLAKWLGDSEGEQEFREEYDDLYNVFMKAVEKKNGKDGALTPGLDAEGGQDWGNLIGVYPAEVMQPWDAHVSATLEKMHKEKFDEGLMTYMGTIHHYITVKEAQSHIFRDEQKVTLEHFYNIMAHMGSTGEMFEWNVEPWGRRDAGVNYPPHGWGSAMFNLMLRNMLIHERGGEGGLSAREIHLGSVLSPEWVQPGKELVFENAPTEHGPISFKYDFVKDGASISIDSKWRSEPKCVVVHVPFFATLVDYAANVDAIAVMKDRLIFPANVKDIRLFWDVDESVEMSFYKTVDTYRKEYRRRVEEHKKAGGEVVKVEVPKRLTAEEREAHYLKLLGPKVAGIAVGKPVETSQEIEGGHPAKLAIDGNSHSLGSSWWTAGAPVWLKVDLEAIHKIDTIKVYPYWDGRRYYQYYVEVSKDGENWVKVADESKNTKPETAKGKVHQFEAIDARYVKITMLYNSSNPSMHLVEMKVFEAK